MNQQVYSQQNYLLTAFNLYLSYNHSLSKPLGKHEKLILLPFRLMSADPVKQARKRSIASALLYIEGVVVLSLGVWVGVMGITHEDREIPPLAGVLLFSLAGGLGLLACGRAFAQRKNWGRGPAVFANLIVLGVVKYQFEGGFLIGAIPLLLLAIPVLYFAVTIIPEERK